MPAIRALPLRDINDETVELVKSFEGIPDGDPSTVKLDPYIDPVGIWTIGWGHAIAGSDGRWLRGMASKAAARALYPGGITLQQAQDLLRADLLDTSRDVSAVVQTDVTDNQFGALVSFAFNLGMGNLKKSTLLLKVNQQDFDAAADEFLKWDKATDTNGVRRALPGLTRRRKAERELFLS